MPSAVHDLEVISSGRSFSIFRSQGVNLGGSASTLCSEGGGGSGGWKRRPYVGKSAKYSGEDYTCIGFQ